jgi:DNA-binding MarR family transcriptional regulator
MTDTNEKQRFDQGEVPLARKVDRMGMLIHRYYEAKAHDHGAMGDPLRGQGRVLALLKAKPETTQRELSYLLDMRQQSLSELLAKLEEKEYITREKSATDGRVTVIRLTEAGAAAAPSPEQMEERADALECLTKEERDQLDQIAGKVIGSLESKLEEMGIDPHQRPHGPRGPHHGPHRGDPRGPQGPMHRGPYRPDTDGEDNQMRRA